MADLGLVYDLRVPFGDPGERARRYRTMLEQVAWADRKGFSRVSIREHHGADDGYLPSPLLAASAVAAVTTEVTILLQALVVTLHDPVRLGEDLAVLDLMSGGRLVVVVGAGYSAEEFSMFGVRSADRPRLVERAIDVLRKSWTGERFDLDGRSVRVMPRPFQGKGPPLVLGGASAAAAARAARIGDGFLPVRNQYYDVYRAALREAGSPDPGPLRPMGPPFLFVAEDPERAWHRIAPFCLHESNAYGALARASGVATGFIEHDSEESLRASGAYPVMTPDEVVALCGELGDRGQLTLPPLAGGMDPELSWESLELLADKVLPRVTLTKVTADDYRTAG